MDETTASISVSFRLPDGSWAAPQGIGVKAGSAAVTKLSIPYCAVDGTQTVCTWDGPNRIGAAPGKHKIETFDRFKGVPLKRRKGKADITIAPGQQMNITAHIGQYRTKLVIT
jgi:hypothetical protein